MRTPLPAPKGHIWSMVYFFELELDHDTIRITTATHDINTVGHDWTSIGQLGKISSIKEGVELLVTRVNLTLQGIPVGLFPLFAAEKYRGKHARLLLGVWEDGLVGNAIPFISGKIDSATIDPSLDMKVSMVLSSDLSTLKYRESSRYSNAEQKILFPGDKGLEFVADLKNLKLQWGVM